MSWRRVGRKFGFLLIDSSIEWFPTRSFEAHDGFAYGRAVCATRRYHSAVLVGGAAVALIVKLEKGLAPHIFKEKSERIMTS